jgi:hypothetical protein
MKTPFIPLLVLVAQLVIPLNISAATVDVVRVPDRGIQPQAAVDDSGTLHLIYFKGAPANGDLFYVTRPVGQSEFRQPIPVNHIAGSAIAMGTIRGAHLALGKNGRVHVAWMGSGPTAKKGEGTHPESPMFYTRLNDSGSAFEPERNIITWTGGLDGGGSVAADSQGDVYVAWHGRAPDAADGEAGRAMFVAVSADDGRTFAREIQANPTPTGACGCCGMRAFVDGSDNLHLLYRTANPVSRDMMLLTSSNHARTFKETPVNRWFTQSCPMSSSVMTGKQQGILLATETGDQVEWASLATDGLKPGSAISVSSAKSGHPSIATNANGDVLVAWAEGAGWAKGGSLKWQLYDTNDAPVELEAPVAEIPTWSFPAAVTAAGNNFVVIY